MLWRFNGSVQAALADAFPELQENKDSTTAMHREFLCRFAQDMGFDPHKAENWETVTKNQLIEKQVCSPATQELFAHIREWDRALHYFGITTIRWLEHCVLYSRRPTSLVTTLPFLNIEVLIVCVKVSPRKLGSIGQTGGISLCI